MRAFISGVLIVLAAGGCADKVTLGPGDALVGSWINPDARFVATHTAVTWTSPCERADFGPITLDNTGNFSVESSSFVISGNILQAPGEQLHLSGSIVDGNLVLTMYVVHSGLGSDPVVVTLMPGASKDPLVCSA